MSKRTKRILSLVAAAVMCVASIGASAAEWRLSGCETSDLGLGNFYLGSALIYQEFDENGFATGRQVSGFSAQEEGLKGFGKVEFKNPWVDRTFPNNEFAKMYVDDNYSGRVYATGRFGEDVVEYRDANFMWEAAAPYKVYTRKQARFIDGWYTDASYPVEYKGENALVTAKKELFGFGMYKVENGQVEIVSAALQANTDPKSNDVVGGLSMYDLSPKTAAQFQPIEFNGDLSVPRTFDHTLAGPTYNFDGSIADPNGKVVIGSELAPENYENLGIDYILTTLKDYKGETNYCEISWTDGGYEIAAPHRCYQFLTIDGVVMDGSAIPGTLKVNECPYECELGHDCTHTVTEGPLYLPYIYRYVGNANPYITWAPEFVAQNGEVVLRRFVEGVADYSATALRNSGIFTNPEYYEVIENNEKCLKALYKFNYNGQVYVFDTNDNVMKVNWSEEVREKEFVESTVLAPYIAE